MKDINIIIAESIIENKGNCEKNSTTTICNKSCLCHEICVKEWWSKDSVNHDLIRSSRINKCKEYLFDIKLEKIKQII